MNDFAATLDTLYSVGHRLFSADRHHDALSLFRTMLIVDPTDERGWLALATCHEALAEPEKAVMLCSLAETACEGNAVRCMIFRARLQRSLGALDEAEASYREAARIAEELDDMTAFAIIQSEAGGA